MTQEELESTLISFCINFPHKVLNTKISGSWFLVYREIGEALTECINSKKMPDLYVLSVLSGFSKGELIKAMELSVQGNLMDTEHYEKALFDLYTRFIERSYKNELHASIAKIIHGVNPIEVVQKMVKQLESLENLNKIETLEDQVQRTIKQIESKNEGINWPFDNFNQAYGKMQPGDLIVIGGRPAMGKTEFAVQLVRHISKEVGCCIVSLEMPSEQIISRFFQADTKIPVVKMRNGRITANEMTEIVISAGNVSKLNLVISDSTYTLNEIIDLIQELSAKGIKFFAVDYIQIVKGNSKHRETEISEISRTLKLTAKKLKVVIVGFAQLSRATETRAEKRPQLSDLRESGAIEQDADSVFFLFRPEYYELEPKGVTELICRKNRHGDILTIPMIYKDNKFLSNTQISIWYESGRESQFWTEPPVGFQSLPEPIDFTISRSNRELPEPTVF